MTESPSVNGGRTGTFTQNGGVHEAAHLSIGAYDYWTGAVGEGTYTLFNSTFGGESYDLFVYHNLTLGEGGMGTFNQNDGYVQVGGDLILGTTADTYDSGPRHGNGYYNLSDYSYLWVDGNAYIGDGPGSYGEFNNTEGYNNVVGDMYIGNGEGSEGHYSMLSGSLSVYGNLYIGYDGGNATFSQSNYSETTAAEVHVGAEGTFSGDGVVFTDLFINNGTLAPGNSPGMLYIEGDYEQNGGGVLRIDIWGDEQGYTYDWLLVDGNASLDGALELNLLGFNPEPDDFFDILTADFIEGSFTSIIGSSGYAWDIEYLDLEGEDGEPDTVRLSANAVPIPAAAWLFGSVIVGIVGVRRKRQ